ncbi:hypothetical protein FQA39_LY00490 [Lamprigera yunnana]|nr:hypothetical protein FQA39_LY00490 [Lamprigera yunnana]
MPPKNKGHNSYYYFMLHLKETPGKRNLNLAQISEIAGPLWKNMNAEQRKPFEQKAKQMKNGANVIKYTTTGQSIAEVLRKHSESTNKEDLMKVDIMNTIKVAVESKTLSDEMFIVIHVNYFCHCTSNDRYYPAEVGIVKFNLRHGVLEENVYNEICKPGTLPLGYLSEAKLISDEIHKIPPPMFSDTENNLPEIAGSLWKFIMQSLPNNRKLPPVYASKKNHAIVANVLSSFGADYGYQDLNVYSLEYLLYILRNACRKEAWAASSLSELELEKHTFEFCDNVACKYHKEIQVPNCCSRSQVIRSVYVICGNCCPDLYIDFIPGQHIPLQSRVQPSRSQSRATSAATSSVHNFREINSVSNEECDSRVFSETSSVVDSIDLAAALTGMSNMQITGKGRGRGIGATFTNTK